MLVQRLYLVKEGIGKIIRAAHWFSKKKDPNIQVQITKSKNCLFSTIRKFWVNTRDLQAFTLVGPTRENLVCIDGSRVGS